MQSSKPTTVTVSGTRTPELNEASHSDLPRLDSTKFTKLRDYWTQVHMKLDIVYAQLQTR